MSILTLSGALAQDYLVSDRPAASFSALSVGKAVLQAQHSIDFTRTEIDIEPVGIDPYSIIGRSYAFTNFVRYGIGNSTEVNGILDLRQSTENGAIGDRNFSGFSKVGLGFRQKLSDEGEIMPATGFLFVSHFNGILNEYRDFNTDGFALILIEKQIAGISFASNLGINYNDIFSDNELYNSFIYTFNVGYSFSPDFFAFVETFGTINENTTDDYYNTGFGYYLNPRLMLDVFGGFTSRTNYLDYFVSTGITYNLGSGN